MRQTALRLLVGFVVLLLPLLLQPSTALAQAFTVNSTLDEPDANPGDGQCVSAPSGVCTLRAAIMEANGRGGSSSITLPTGTFKLTIAGANEDGGATGDLDVFANLTITGAGAASTIIDGNQVDNVLDVHTGVTSTTLSGLSIQNANGAGIQFGSSTLSVASSAITGNKQSGISGGTGAVTVTDSNVSGNGLDGMQAAATISVTRSTLNNNAFAGINSEAALSSTVTVSVAQSTIDNNRLGVNGPNVIVTDSVIKNNQSPPGPPATGGGIAGGSITVQRSTVTNNGGVGGTGGLYGIGAVTVSDSTITNNVGSSASAGGGSGGAFSETSLTVTNSTITGNTGPNGAGLNATQALTIANSTVSSNNTTTTPGPTGQISGGGVFVGGPATITNSVIRDNVAQSGSNLPVEAGAGGGLYVSDLANVTITNTTISGNSTGASGTGGGIFVNSRAKVTLNGVTISNNSTPGSGGGLFLTDDANTLATITNTTISGNSAATGGGIYQAGAGTLTLTNDTIANNTVSTNGSSLYKVNGTVQIKNTIVANTAGSPNCFRATPITSLGNNIDSGASCGFNGPNDLSNTDPKLGPLADNGGPTQTMALLPGSLAIDRANDNGCPPTDQRGFTRPVDGDNSPPATCDIGAFEAGANTSPGPPTPTPTSTPPPSSCAPRPPVTVSATPDGSGGLRVTVSTSSTGGTISALQFGAATNAQITAPGGPPNAAGNFTVSPPAGATNFTFTVRRTTAGQATQVPFTVTDACGSWPTFAGGGPSAF